MTNNKVFFAGLQKTVLTSLVKRRVASDTTCSLVAMHDVAPMRSRTTEFLESRERLDTTESIINQLVAVDKVPSVLPSVSR